MPDRFPHRQIRRTLLALLALLPACHAAAPAPGPPEQVVVSVGDNQQGAVGSTLAVAPAVKVRDSRGNGLAGIVVRFAVTGGGGHLTGDSTMTNASGVATLGSWVLGTIPGGNSILATVDRTTVGASINAIALAGPPAAVRVIGSQLFTAMTTQVIAPSPTVQVVDAYTNLIVGIPVTFAVTAGNGSVTGATVVTNAQGQAQVGSWTLGTIAGLNRLTASTSNGVNVVFTANGLVGNPLLTTTTPTEQSGFLSFPVTAIPRVKVTDGSGTPLANVTVAFALTSGDGTLTGTLALTGTDGIATPSDWRLGPSAGSSTLVATLPNFPGPSLSFHATGVATPFTIDVRFLTAMSADSRDAFVVAARRWMQIIVGDIPNQALTLAAGACATGQPAINETIDDVVIYASVVPIDGPFNVLGSAGPCVRRTPSLLTIVGTMRFDQDDLALLQTTNRLVPTIVHEMGHVLGFGTSWADTLRRDVGLTDPIYVGAEAMALWPTFNTALQYAGRPIPLADVGGAGTRDSHWRESVFHAELMTGIIEATGVPMPISRLTIATFRDMGYVVDYNAADSFLGNLLASPFAVFGTSVPLNDQVVTASFEVGPDGRVRRVN